MKRFITSCTLLILVVALGIVGIRPASADSNQTLPDAQIERIKQNCFSAHATISQLQKSDTLLRLNLGQQYEFIAGKLMAPLNSRLVINQMSVGSFITTATTFQQQINSFRSAYTTYGESLSLAAGDDCQRNPQQFYNDVVSARTNRQAVQSIVGDLSDTVQSYGAQADAFTNNLKVAGGN